MLMYDVIVIGFGKAGKTLAGKLASAGKKVKHSQRNYQAKEKKSL